MKARNWNTYEKVNKVVNNKQRSKMFLNSARLRDSLFKRSDRQLWLFWITFDDKQVESIWCHCLHNVYLKSQNFSFRQKQTETVNTSNAFYEIYGKQFFWNSQFSRIRKSSHFSLKKIIKTRGCGLTTLQSLPFFPGASRRNLKFASATSLLSLKVNLKWRNSLTFLWIWWSWSSNLFQRLVLTSNILRLTMKGPKASSRLEKRIQIGARHFHRHHLPNLCIADHAFPFPTPSPWHLKIDRYTVILISSAFSQLFFWLFLQDDLFKPFSVCLPYSNGWGKTFFSLWERFYVFKYLMKLAWWIYMNFMHSNFDFETLDLLQYCSDFSWVMYSVDGVYVGFFSV